jgi:hypothetical protein
MPQTTNDAARLLALADKAHALADTMQDLNAKRTMLDIAVAYLILARQAEATAAAERDLSEDE